MPGEPASPDGQPARGAVATAERRGRAVLYGVGFDADGHTRITTGPGYCLTGGGEDTHATMHARAAWFVEEIRRRGYSLDNLTRAQAEEVAGLVEQIRP